MIPAASDCSSARNSVMLAGTPAARSIRKKRISMAPGASAGAARPAGHEHELLEGVHVRLVLERAAVERRDRRFRVVRAQGIRRDVLGDEEPDPVEELRGGRFL